MFENTGEKLKSLAVTFFVVDVIASVIAGIVTIANDEALVLVGVGVIAGGIFVGYIISLLIAAFGEMVCASTESEGYLKILSNKVDALEKKLDLSGTNSEGSAVDNGHQTGSVALENKAGS